MNRVSAGEAASLIQDGWTVAASGFGGFGHPEAVTAAIEKRFLAESNPRDLTLLFASSNGDRRRRGMNHFGNEGMVSRVIAGGWRGTPRLGALAADNRIEAYNWPQGVICQLYRAIASGQPGVVTAVGIDTFVDPRRGGGRLNGVTGENLVQLIDVAGSQYLLYPSQRIDAALIRATTSDTRGNLTLEEEAFPQDMLAMAQAARNSGGIVIVQVKRIAQAGDLDPQRVKVPATLVDYVVVVEDEDQHWMSFGEKYNGAYLGDPDAQGPRIVEARPPDSATIVQRRAFLELRQSGARVVNLGIGIPSGIAAIASQANYSSFMLTIESGVIGGVAAGDLSFGAASFPEAVIDQSAQFDFYAGGGVDIAFLGMLQLDSAGNVNVGKLGSRLIGTGGFIDISQSAKTVCFVGTFTARGLEVAAHDGRLAIRSEGAIPKIVDDVEQVAFSARWARERGRRVAYITERAVFELEGRGLVLREVAPGIDVRRNVTDLLPRGVHVAEHLKLMDAGIFRDRFGTSEH